MKREYRRFHRLLAGQLFLRLLAQPAFILVYVIAWYRLLCLCLYGGLRKNGLILCGCALFFLFYLLLFLILLLMYGRRNEGGRVLWLRECGAAGLTARDEGGAYTETVAWEEIRKAICRRRMLYLFCKKGRFVALQTEGAEGPQARFLREKLGGLSFWRRSFLAPAICVFLAAVTAAGALGVAYSGVKYHGKLSWFLAERKNTRRVTYEQDNLYDEGIDGLLSDLEKKIDLPAHLKLENSFQMHFAPDGTVLSLSMGISGFDEQYRMVGSWLISYNAAESDKLRIVVGGIGSPQWESEKDLQPLLDALRVIPIEGTVNAWPGQEVYGILFYGERSWGYRTEGIRYIDRKGNVELPGAVSEEIVGPSISVFVPGKEQELTPVRYLFCEDVAQERNVK